MRIFADKSSSESREKLKEEIRSIFEESIKNNSNPKYTVL
jgi:gas vesicle protein